MPNPEDLLTTMMTIATNSAIPAEGKA